MKQLVLYFWMLSQAVQAQIGNKINSPSAIAGRWENNAFGYSMILELNPGGTGTFDGVSIRYKLEEGKLTITDESLTSTYNYLLQGNTLTLSGGDLTEAISFTKPDSKTGKSPSGNTWNESPSGNKDLTGTWTSPGETLVFKANGQLELNGYPLTYSISGNQLNITTPQGQSAFRYQITGNTLSIDMNGQNQVYTKAGSVNNDQKSLPDQNQSSGSANKLTGRIDPGLVGKWCYYSGSSSSTGSFSSSRCLTIYENGSYEYYSESSGSASGYNQYGNQTYAGGMAGGNTDRGQWRVDGNIINVISEQYGFQQYSLQKVNNENNDPMIIVNGEKFVSYYQKPAW